MDGVFGAYRRLLAAFGRQGWWPVSPDGVSTAAYAPGRHPDSLCGLQRLEVAWGCLLCQNTTWTNASCAVENLRRAGLIDEARLLHCNLIELAATIRPSGYYNQKAAKLRALAGFMKNTPGWPDIPTARLRPLLLSVKGVGPETADSILLYALGRRVFVVDAYTRRVFSRLGLAHSNADYDDMRVLVESTHLDVMALLEFHALLVELAKRNCTKRKPDCRTCPLKASCWYAKTANSTNSRQVPQNHPHPALPLIKLTRTAPGKTRPTNHTLTGR